MKANNNQTYAQKKLGKLPVWKLKDLYSSQNDKNLTTDLNNIKKETKKFEKKYLNKIKRLNPLDNNHLIACGLHDGLMIFKIMLKKIKLNKNINYILKLHPKAANHEIINLVNYYNLKNLTVNFPLGKFISVTGVSGSGKSTLITDILSKSIQNEFSKNFIMPGLHKSVSGLENLDKLIEIDQSPIGRTPRSNPATYSGVFDQIRNLFSLTEESKIRGYKPGRFSFNVPGGRCEFCKGDGNIKVEMYFLPDIYVVCDECNGTRYNSETLSIRWKGYNIAEILNSTVENALTIFENQPSIYRIIKTLDDVGLSYIKLGQAATTLSGGEAQRVKLAKELSKRSTGKTVYILDEPTTGLHFADVQKLLEVLHMLVDKGNTVIVIEHNLDVIKNSDWIIDLGPEGGENGGTIIGEGTPESISKNKSSLTGKHLKEVLNGKN